MESIAPVHPRDDQTQDIHGVPLTDLLARCRSMAHRYYRQQGRWEPFEEYLSAGYLAIAQCIQSYDPEQAPPGGFLSYTCFQMEMRMRDVRRMAAGPHNIPRHVTGTYQEPKFAVASVDHEILYALRTTPATQETTTYLYEIVGYLQTQGKPSAMLFASVNDESETAIATHWACTVDNVKKHLWLCRKRLRQWASWSAA